MIRRYSRISNHDRNKFARFDMAISRFALNRWGASVWAASITAPISSEPISLKRAARAAALPSHATQTAPVRSRIACACTDSTTSAAPRDRAEDCGAAAQGNARDGGQRRRSGRPLSHHRHPDGRGRHSVPPRRPRWRGRVAAMKPLGNPRIFMGFYGMSFADGAEKLAGLLNTCRR